MFDPLGSVMCLKLSFRYAYLNVSTDGTFYILLGIPFQILPPAYLNDIFGSIQ